MAKPDTEKRVRRAIQVVIAPKKMSPKSTDSFVETLGFNSLRMVSLSLALEEEFERPLLLSDWIASAKDPNDLTVGSLCEHVERVLENGHEQ